MMDFSYSIAMFVVAITGLRYVLKDQWKFDIFDFSTMPAKIAGGLISVLMLFSIYRTISDPKKARALGRAITGRDYNMATAQAVVNVGDKTQGEIASINKVAGTTSTIGNRQQMRI